MPNIKPVSDLRSYSTVLDEVSIGSPVFLTKNGRGRYAILDMRDYERYEAKRELLLRLDAGLLSAQESGTLSPTELEARFAGRFNGDAE